MDSSVRKFVDLGRASNVRFLPSGSDHLAALGGSFRLFTTGRLEVPGDEVKVQVLKARESRVSGTFDFKPGAGFITPFTGHGKSLACNGPECPVCMTRDVWLDAEKKHRVTFVRCAQFRFPRSKKVRIQKKWRRDPKNWKSVFQYNFLDFSESSKFAKFLKGLPKRVVAPSDAHPSGGYSK
jgi:hypothetical protein